MKASRLFSLVAMAALAVGCTQEEFAPVGENAAVDLSNRPSLGDVVLNMGPETRMAIADGSSLKLTWAENDQLGASIIDEPKADTEEVSGKDFTAEGGKDFSSLRWSYAEYKAGTKQALASEPDGPKYSAQEAGVDISQFYTVKEFVSSNYPYLYQNGEFTTQANLVEGNYMFYAPYNPQLLLRERVNVVLPMIQDCSDDVMMDTNYKGKASKVENGGGVSSTALEQFYAGTMAGFEKAPVLVGYKFLAAPENGETVYPKVTLSHLFAYPMITIENKDFAGYIYDGATNETTPKGAQTITIDSIQIYHGDATSKLIYKAAIGSDKVATALKKDGEWDGKRLNTVDGAPTSDVFDNTVTTDDIYPDYNISGNSLEQPQITAAQTNLAYQRQHVTCEIDKELAPGASYHFHAVLPAGDYGENLKARLFVTIGEKHYVLVKATNTETGTNTNKYRSSAWADFTFIDTDHGGKGCELVRGEHYPKAEFKEDGTGAKAFAGTMMTISLGGNGVAALELNKEAVAGTTYGFKDNDEFITYLQNYVQRGVAMTEAPSLNYVKQEEWATTTVGGSTSAGNFAFAEDTKCIIDADFIKRIYQQTVDDATQNDVMLTLTETSLPIASDVKYEVSGTIYTFTTLDEKPVSFKIEIESTVTLGDDAGALAAGINKIGETGQSSPVTGELKVAEGVANAVVYLTGEASPNTTTVTLKDCTGISAIYVNRNTVLDVETNCTALIIANGGTINVRNNGSLTNVNNEFSGTTVVNSNVNLPTIAGTVADGVKVAVEFSSVWPEDKIPAATQINTVTINRSEEGTQTIEQAQMDIFANLTKGVELTLGDNITGITSKSDVTLTNLKSLDKADTNDVTWTSGTNAGIKVYKVEIGGAETTIDAGIKAGTNVTFE